jgi:hypothetical protein
MAIGVDSVGGGRCGVIETSAKEVGATGLFDAGPISVTSGEVTQFQGYIEREHGDYSGKIRGSGKEEEGRW